MQRNALARCHWPILLGGVIALCAAGPSQAAQAAAVEAARGELAIGSPLPNALVAGRITLSVAYNSGFNRIQSFTLFVDGQIHSSREFIGMNTRGVYYFEVDTRMLADGNHTLRIVARGTRGVLGDDTINITVRNGVAGGQDTVPPLVQFRGLTDNQTVAGKILLDVLAEDNTTRDLLVSIFINRAPRLIKSTPPYGLELDTAPFLDPNTGTGKITIEAWAYDQFQNLGKSRSLTLNVVPAGKINETRIQADPTLQPALTRPMPMDVEPRANLNPLRAPMEGGLVVPLPPRGDLPPMRAELVPPSPARGQLGGRPVMERLPSVPGGRDPLAPRMARSTPSGIDPEFAPVGSAGTGSSLEGSGRLRTPAAPQRPNASAAGLSGARDLAAPELLSPRSEGSGSGSLGVRSSTPAVRPQVKSGPPVLRQGPTVMARAEANPGGGLTVTVPGEKGVSSDTPRSAREATGMPMPRVSRNSKGEVIIPLPVPGGKPMASGDGQRDTMPNLPVVAPPAENPDSDPMLVVVDRQKKPDANGRIPLELYRLKRSPRDRNHTVRTGESAAVVAKKYGVTEKSLLVANGLSSGRRLRAGSILKVPGAFDVVLNDRQVAFDVNPRVENGLPLAPFRQIFEHAGGVVVWYPETREVRAASDEKDVRLKIGSKEAVVNQMVMVMDREAFIDSGRTIVPINFMEKALDLKAEYDVKNGSIILVKR